MVRIAAAAELAAATPVYAAPEKDAVFDFQFSNLSTAPTDQANQACLRHESDAFRTLRETEGLFTVVSNSPENSKVTQGLGLRRCNGCADDLARRRGAEVAITGEAQKVSNLSLNLNVYSRPLAGDATDRAYSVDLRGDPDASFDRGIRFPVENDMDADKPLGRQREFPGAFGSIQAFERSRFASPHDGGVDGKAFCRKIWC